MVSEVLHKITENQWWPRPWRYYIIWSAHFTNEETHRDNQVPSSEQASSPQTQSLYSSKPSGRGKFIYQSDDPLTSQRGWHTQLRLHQWVFLILSKPSLCVCLKTFGYPSHKSWAVILDFGGSQMPWGIWWRVWIILKKRRYAFQFVGMGLWALWSSSMNLEGSMSHKV